MRVLISVAASLMLMLALVGPVAAAGSGGCSAFGAASAAGGHRESPMGSERFGFYISGAARAGLVSGIVAGEHSTMCAP